MAFYFEYDNPESMVAAIPRARKKLDEGWKPDWKHCLRRFPKGWSETAERFIAVAIADSGYSPA